MKATAKTRHPLQGFEVEERPSRCPNKSKVIGALEMGLKTDIDWEALLAVPPPVPSLVADAAVTHAEPSLVAEQRE